MPVDEALLASQSRESPQAISAVSEPKKTFQFSLGSVSLAFQKWHNQVTK